jgi:hypothetical protein
MSRKETRGAKDHPEAVVRGDSWKREYSVLFSFFRISFFPLEPVYIISNSKVATTSGSVIWFTMVTTNAW